VFFFIPCICDKIKKINGCRNTNDQITTLLVMLLDIWSDSTCPDEHIMIKWSLFDSLLRNIQITIHIKNYFQFFYLPNLNSLWQLFIHKIVHPSIHPSIYPSIHPSIPFIHSTLHLCKDAISTRWWVWSISGKIMTKENLSQYQFFNHKFYIDCPDNEAQPLQRKFAFFLQLSV